MATLAISVVVPSRRGTRLALALDALAGQTLAADEFEVVVAQDPLSEELPGDVPPGLNVRWIRAEEACGPAVKRNLGWRAARAPLVAFTDDDCEPTPDWLERLVAASREAPGAILQGSTSPNPRELDRLGPFSRTLRVDSPSPWFATCNVAYPFDLLVALEGFDETYTAVAGEDTDLAWRGRESGAPDVFVEDAHVHHAVEDIGAVGKLRVAARWHSAVALFVRHPKLRSYLYLGLFWKQGHALLLLAVFGLLLGRRFPPALALAIPFARNVRARLAQERAGLAYAPYYALHDAVEIGTAVTGSLRFRTLVL